MKITNKMSLYLRFLHQEGHVSCKELKQRYPNYALRSIYRHAKKKITVKMPVDGRKLNRGRPKKITVRDERKLLWTLQRLRNAREPFTVKSLRIQAGLMHLSTRTINRCLNKHNYKYLQLRKKGLLTSSDKRKRLCFARSVKKLPENFWKGGVSFYLDGVSFAHKTNPQNKARSSRTKAWRKPNEGLSYTTKGKKDGNGGRMAHFLLLLHSIKT